MARVWLPYLVGAAILVPLGTAGCAHEYRVYDDGHRDYHVWNRSEVTFYARWETETHRDHREFRDRKGDEQREYFEWRHRQ